MGELIHSVARSIRFVDDAAVAKETKLGSIEEIGKDDDHDETYLVSIEEAVEPLELLLPEIKSKTALAKQHAKMYHNSLSLDESSSLALYSMEWEPHAECLYVVLNATLRSENRTNLTPWYLYLKLIITALSRLPSVHMTVYRGIQLDLSKSYPKGSTFTWWSFSSCTASVDVLQSFMNTIGVRTLFAIECLSGKDIQHHSLYPNEQEILLNAGVRFQVTAHFQPSNDLHIIQLKQLEQPSSRIHPLTVVPRTATERAEEQRMKIEDPRAYNILQFREEFCRQCTWYSSIQLREKTLDEEHMKIVVKKMKYPKFNKVSLSSCKITLEGIQVFVDDLRSNTIVEELDLSSIKLQPSALQCIMEALSKNTTVKKLDMSSCEIGDDGAVYVAQFLLINATLADLDLRFNKIDDTGLQKIFSALCENTSLKILNLRWNKFNVSGVNSLVQMLKVNYTLTVLDLKDCGYMQSYGYTTRSSWNDIFRIEEAFNERKVPDSICYTGKSVIPLPEAPSQATSQKYSRDHSASDDQHSKRKTRRTSLLSRYTRSRSPSSSNDQSPSRRETDRRSSPRYSQSRTPSPKTPQQTPTSRACVMQ
ncbi:unnamed protein product [Rotaria magnacalcarata]|uniref:NAD(P)(+)--arginine ADP-ribosyltransferase n=1 Tax=Rotaria magnacalcarata TaxID=392030 RepID=A0A816W8X7_9BILA|nr:unnamed protein product [Rotaria magnacalcarata]